MTISEDGDLFLNQFLWVIPREFLERQNYAHMQGVAGYQLRGGRLLGPEDVVMQLHHGEGESDSRARASARPSTAGNVFPNPEGQLPFDGQALISVRVKYRSRPVLFAGKQVGEDRSVQTELFLNCR